MQREFGRLNLKGTVMSKRDITALIENKIVRVWDDPHLYTLKGVRRRGIAPGALLSFIYGLVVTTETSSIEIEALRAICAQLPRDDGPLADARA